MNLIKLYIQEVTRRLPDKTRDDIALELESTIYDMLPEDHSDEDVYQALETLGDPAILAGKYNEKPMHFIGPRYYHGYVTLLKLIMPIAATISFITIIFVNLLGPVEEGAVLETMIHLLGIGIWNVVSVLIQTFFWITIVFIIVERADVAKNDASLPTQLKSWTPNNLKHITYIPKYKMIKNFELSCGLIWTAIWGTAYFYADHLLGIYENGHNGLRMVTPAFNQEMLLSFWPFIVLIIGLEVALTIFKLVKKQWTRQLATFFAINQAVSLIILVVILTRENLFNQEFLNKIGKLFTTSPPIIENILIWGTIVIFIVSTGWGIFDTFKRANIKS